NRPDSFDWYAIHLPSGENWPSRSSKGVFRKGNGFLSPETGRTHKSKPVCGSLLRNSRKRPSEDQSVGTLSLSDASSNSSATAPLDSFQYRLKTPVRLDAKTTRRPSDDQTGKLSALASKVNRFGIPRSASMSQTSVFPLTARSTATHLPSGDSS